MMQRSINLNDKAKSVKNRSNSSYHNINVNKRQRLNTIDQTQHIIERNESIFNQMFCIKDKSLVIKKQFHLTGCLLSVQYRLDQEQQNDDKKQSQKKVQYFSFHLKHNELTMIKNSIKHFHTLTSEISKSNMLLDLKANYKILHITIENPLWFKSLALNIQKIQYISTNINNLHVICPFQYIEEGIKIRALRFQSAGSKKKIVWGQNSAGTSTNTNKTQVKTTQFYSQPQIKKKKSELDQSINFCQKRLNFNITNDKQNVKFQSIPASSSKKSSEIFPTKIQNVLKPYSSLLNSSKVLPRQKKPLQTSKVQNKKQQSIKKISFALTKQPLLGISKSMKVKQKVHILNDILQNDVQYTKTLKKIKSGQFIKAKVKPFQFGNHQILTHCHIKTQLEQ